MKTTIALFTLCSCMAAFGQYQTIPIVTGASLAGETNFTTSASYTLLSRPVLTTGTTIGFVAKWDPIADDDTNKLTFTLEKSYDAEVWEPLLVFERTAYDADADPVPLVTNATLNAYGYVRVGAITNASEEEVTGLSVTLYHK